MTSTDPETSTALQDVLLTRELGTRPARVVDNEAENRVLADLARGMAEEPERVLRQVADAALALCDADSAGVSLLGVHEGKDVFRWTTIAGQLEAEVGGVLPRECCPCATVVRQNSPQLFKKPDRYFPVLRGLDPAVEEALLVPIHVEGTAAGALWTMSHRSDRAFDSEDGRLLSVLARFASAACTLLERGRLVEELRKARVAALNLTEDAVAARAEVERSNRALHDIETRTRIAVEAAGLGMWDWNLETNELRWNDQHYVLLGLKRDCDDFSAEEFFRAVHPDDRDRLRKLLRTNISDRRTFVAEYRILRADGATRWMSGYGKVVEEVDGRPVRVAGVLADITARKDADRRLRESEQTLRLMIESAREYAIFSADLDGLVRTWSSGAERLLGYSEGEIIGHSMDVIFTEEDRESGIPGLEMENALRSDAGQDERWHVRKDGERFWANGCLMAMRDEDGRARGFVKIMRDQTEAQLAREALESASRAKDDFLAVLSHELRTPLTPVLMAVGTMARRKDLPPKMLDTIEMIRRNVLTEAHLIDDLLDITRISQGKMVIVAKPVDGHEVIRAAVEVARSDMEDKEQVFDVELAAPRVQLLGDADRLKQVVWNLLKNAAKFTDLGGRVSLKTRNAGEDLVISITDNGVGIDGAALPKIFDAFAQASPEVTKVFGGLGLGLAISKATVEAHGGTIEASSGGAGQGATLTVKLPIQTDI